jgi:hypothetical protein
MKRQNFAAVSALATGLAAGQAISETISTQLGLAHNLQGQSEFLCFVTHAS